MWNTTRDTCGDSVVLRVQASLRDLSNPMMSSTPSIVCPALRHSLPLAPGSFVPEGQLKAAVESQPASPRSSNRGRASFQVPIASPKDRGQSAVVSDQDGNLKGRGGIPPGGPHQTNVDLAVAKNTALTEKMNLELRVEFFNIFNHPQFANPSTNVDLTSPHLGRSLRRDRSAALARELFSWRRGSAFEKGS